MGLTPGSFKKGHIPWNKGKKGCYTRSKATRLKVSRSLKGKSKHITKEGHIKKVEASKARWATPEYKFKMSKAIRLSNQRRKGTSKPSGHPGETNGRWKDGRTIKWRQARESCFRRDNFTCILCNVRGAYLNAHHIINRHQCRDLYEVSNLVTLCRSCHNSITNIESTNEYERYKLKFINYIEKRRCKNECRV